MPIFTRLSALGAQSRVSSSTLSPTPRLATRRIITTSALPPPFLALPSALFLLADQAATATETVVQKNNSGIGFLADPLEGFLKVLDKALETAHVPYSYGFAIILLTFIVKLATYPLTKKQVESSLAIQALQPRIAELRRVYGNNQEKLQLETARLYKEANVNPLAGCLPTLVTLPVWIGLYRALTNVAGEGLLTEGWFWIPSLAGPVALNPDGSSASGLSWLFPLVDGAPPVGWNNAAAYLLLPILLIASQYVSQKMISPPQTSQDPAMKQTQAILGFLPFMIGWFSLNVPSGLTLYWFTNNILTTAQQLYLRKATQLPAAITNVASSSLDQERESKTIRNPIVDIELEEDKKPSGRELNARRSKKRIESDDNKGSKFRAIRAREAASRAASQADGGGEDKSGGQGDAPPKQE